eukprot:4199522-Alexandrium_andersonii.AAC.1
MQGSHEVALHLLHRRPVAICDRMSIGHLAVGAQVVDEGGKAALVDGPVEHSECIVRGHLLEELPLGDRGGL